MMFWVLVVLAAAPILMAGLLFLMLRTGVIHRLHERRRAMHEADTPLIVVPDAASATTDPDDSTAISGGGGDSGGGGGSSD